MVQNPLVNQLHSILGIVLYMTLPPLVGAVAVGLFIGVVQAATQIQDQSLPLTFKLIIVLAILTFAGPLLTAPLVRETIYLLDNFSLMTR
ncbi:flagellar biosynthetic protein FliQ [Bradyrhizobium sp. Tv2a-2]|uniref:EscS/YscS/HrcS family type III secretion system export apparatus protein n=1 Tax=Bradyrhizobium sp. Tv2a-2 TaxID=113395 RepID=UPI000465878F|nr:flagellar biosynthetic protein FliQ [Bradyrhizobium sp. Tv2a-2]